MHTDIESYKQVLAILEQELGPDHSVVSRALCTLGLALNKAKRYDEAIECFNRARTIDAVFVPLYGLLVAHTMRLFMSIVG